MASAHGAAAAPGDVVIPPDWLRKPSWDDLVKSYPAGALRAGATGKAKIECKVDATGLLNKCEVLTETPLGFGFGAAALSMTRYFSWRPQTVNGVPVGGASAVIPVDFGLSSGDYGAVVVIPMGFVARVDLVALGIPAAHAAAPAITNPDWVRRPDANVFVSVYPAEAQRKGISGAAKIECVVTVEGKLDQCVVLEETPSDGGFGQAALRLSQYFLMRPRMVNGVPAGGAVVIIPIRFALPPAPHLLETPIWASQATPGQIAAAFPRDRLATTDEEHVILRCKVLADGGMGRCGTVEDDPSFYAAAQSLAKYYRLDLAAYGKPPLDDTYVDLSILFKASSAAAR